MGSHLVRRGRNITTRYPLPMWEEAREHIALSLYTGFRIHVGFSLETKAYSIVHAETQVQNK